MATALYITLILSLTCEVFFLIVFGIHIERNVSFLGPLLESDSFRHLATSISFLRGLIRDGGGTVHVPRSVEVPRFSHVYLTRGLYIFRLTSIGRLRLSQ